jgi:hypothetical protein
MTSYGGVDIAGDCWGVDTAMAGTLTDGQLQRMKDTPLPNGQLPVFIWGYVPLPGNSSRWDMTGERMRAAADMGWIVLLVQHCRAGSWMASAGQGAADGAFAADYATQQGYPSDCHLAADDEAVATPGTPSIQHFTEWCKHWPSACIYEGFAPGMSPTQLYEIPDVQCYWGAYGPWYVSKRGVRCRQGLQITHAGVGVDPDHASPDALGGVLRGFGRLDLHA